MKGRCLGISLLGLLTLAAPLLAGDDKVQLKRAKYDVLMKRIGEQKGKVVVIDFWADT